MQVIISLQIQTKGVHSIGAGSATDVDLAFNLIFLTESSPFQETEGDHQEMADSESNDDMLEPVGFALFSLERTWDLLWYIKSLYHERVDCFR